MLIIYACINIDFTGMSQDKTDCTSLSTGGCKLSFIH